ncbi:arginyl-tRNA--protein transferase 1 isoform X1 [Drosophila montana]|uniref:arginyl-tRNA--protein transferase 1 isoform X1 n=1 Tax=Drosophila montana TaxID=40370 RepID=UPI00313CA925
MSVSIVQYYGEQTSKCGYCTGTDCSKSHGMHAYRLTCDDYQELIDRGWRRCGNYCYKPQNDITCCPCYTIKCDALEFKLTKSNKRILRRMNNFLRDGKREPSEQQQQTAGESKNADVADVVVGVNASDPQPQLPDKKPSLINVEQVESLAAEMKSACPAPGLDVTAGKGDPAASLLVSNKCKTLTSNLNPPRKKAKQMRLERRQAKLGAPLEQPPLTKTLKQEKSLKDFLAAPCDTDKHNLKIVLVAASDTQRTCADAVHALYRKYQLVIHNDNPARLTLASMQRFLVKSPLKHQTTEDAPDMGYGSFHHQYWLDGKLIAVGVIDILPGSVSSVYFFYDPEYSFLSLGTYGSLREIDLVQTIAERVPALKYYYMGFYIHSCPKMRYKGKLSASYLLCPETYVWVPLTDAVRSKLDVEKYQRLNPDATAKDVNEFLNQHLNDVMLLLDAKTCVSYNSFVQLTGVVGDRDVIIEYSKLVGRVCAQRMLFVNMS